MGRLRRQVNQNQVDQDQDQDEDSFCKMMMMAWEMKETARAQVTGKMATSNSYVKRDELTQDERIYWIHDNGARPFKVHADKDGIRVYMYANKEEEESVYEDQHNAVYTKLVYEAKDFTGYWSGFDSSPHVIHGSSILIEIKPREYVYIGREIKRFTTQDRILDFISCMGNSDVPYPIAYGEENVYYMLDMAYVPRDELKTAISVEKASRLWDEYYGINAFRKNKSKRNKHKMEDVEMIHDRR